MRRDSGLRFLQTAQRGGPDRTVAAASAAGWLIVSADHDTGGPCTTARIASEYLVRCAAPTAAGRLARRRVHGLRLPVDFLPESGVAIMQLGTKQRIFNVGNRRINVRPVAFA